MIGKLSLIDKTILEGESFGFEKSIAGEVVFSTGMVGYPESLTDPSYAGQILIMTYPLIGNYGVPDKKYWESDKIQISGLTVSSYINTPSHFQSKRTLADWLRKEKIPALEIKDTRFLTQKIRTKGAILGKFIFDKDLEFRDPNKENLVANVSTKKVLKFGRGKKRIVLIDCGAKKNIARSLLRRDVSLTIIPWNFDLFKSNLKFNAILISNGPGDPKMAEATIRTVRTSLERKIPTFGICMGNQILALAAGGNTSKLKFGHRSQNQPCLEVGTKRCYLTTQNHGFVVSKIPKGFSSWFINANDGTNEGIKHRSLPFMSVQFHPEATPGPTDTDWIFDYFLKQI